METKKLLTQVLHTGDITIISNITCITATGDKVARIEESLSNGVKNPATVHVDFEVKQSSHLHNILEDTRSLGLILQPDDAVELGVLLLALGMKNNNPLTVETTMNRLSAILTKR